MDLEQGGGEAMAAAMAVASDAQEEISKTDGNSSSDLLMLTENQLRRLALLLRNNEEPLMARVIKSETERAKYLKTVNDSYSESIKLLNDITALKAQRFSGARSQVARDVHDHVVYGLNMCMQKVRNCYMRVDAIAKLRAHHDALAGALADPAADVQSLATEASEYRASMWERCHNSGAYSKMLMMEGVGFPELVRRHQLKLGLGADNFEDLKESQKLEVYNSIIMESGRAQVPLRFLSDGRKLSPGKKADGAVFLQAAGNLVWDIFTKEHNVVKTILRGSLNVMVAVGALAVGAAVTKAVANVGLSVFASYLAGLVVGAIAGLISIAMSGLLIGLVFGSPRKVPPLAELKFHTAVMPDGISLAYAIARD